MDVNNEKLYYALCIHINHAEGLQLNKKGTNEHYLEENPIYSGMYSDSGVGGKYYQSYSDDSHAAIP